jgi:hypothetical protein
MSYAHPRRSKSGKRFSKLALPLEKIGEGKALTESPHNKKRIYTMIRVRAQSATHLCLTGNSYTGFNAGLSHKKQSATYLPVLCSCLSLKLILPHLWA